jgi:hypothetical protein
MATLEERIQNLTQDINPSSGRMSDEEVRRIRQNDPMAARFGSADTGFYTDQPKDFTNEEKVYNTLVELQRNAQTPEESEKLLQMISQRNKTLLSGVPDPMMSGVDTNPMQPLVEMGFGEQVDIILGNPADSDISRQAQQQIINEMGTGMDIDSFLMEVNNLAPKGAMSNIDAEVMQRLMSAGRDGDTAIGHLTEGEVVIPAPVLEANPQAANMLEQTMTQMGIDPRTRVVDSTGEIGGIASINPETGFQEFGFLSDVWKKAKKVVKAVAPIAVNFIPGVGPLAKAALTAGIGKASGLSTKDALLGGALSYGGSKLFGGTPAAGSAGKASTGNIFSRVGEYIMPGKDGIGLLGNLGKSASGAYEYVMPGKDNVGLFGNVKSGIGNLFNSTPESDIIKYDPVNQGYVNIQTGMPATASEIASLTSQSGLGRIEDLFKTVTGDDGMTRTQELQLAGYTPEQIEQLKANGTFNAVVSQVRDQNQGQGRGAVGAIQNALTGGGDGTSSGGMGMMGKLGIAGLAGLIGKLAYEEAKNQKGVPLTPLTQMDQLGRYNIAAEMARQAGEGSPSRVEYGLNPEGMPALSGGRPTVSEGMVYQPPEKRMMAYGGIMNLNGGGSTGFAERMEVADKLIDSLIPTRKETGAAINEDERNLLNRYSIDRAVEAVPFVPNFIENLVQSDKYKDFESATMDFITPALRHESGAAITYDEINAMKKSLIPMPGDREEVIEAKSMARKNIINKMRSMNSDTQEPNKTKVFAPQRRYDGGIMNLNMGGMPRYNYGGGVQYFNQGGTVAMAEGGDMDATINIENFPVKDGQIDGPGTETSDDIPAMLSDGEFVMTAKAVKGAGAFNINDNNGILTLTPNGDPSRDSGTRVMYKLMEHFGKVA